ncbi:DUF1707 domain-containing protein [Actinosynnema sp. NPDC050801]|uniref:DUF1707 SHOCT-like domain-containing protein n=1 Tax=unclassified Actinosynnema TaxID=2637065 RepID=UPI0033EC7330
MRPTPDPHTHRPPTGPSLPDRAPHHPPGTDPTPTDPPPHEPPPPLRASDTDRDHTAARLRDAVGEGRLTLAEADHRIAAAYTAVHRHDLAALTADLPAPPPPPPTTTPARRRPPLLPVALLLITVAWIASPLPFPWPLLLIALLVHRGVRHHAHRRAHPGRPRPRDAITPTPRG